MRLFLSALLGIAIAWGTGFLGLVLLYSSDEPLYLLLASTTIPGTILSGFIASRETATKSVFCIALFWLPVAFVCWLRLDELLSWETPKGWRGALQLAAVVVLTLAVSIASTILCRRIRKAENT
jgi:hypothetical protein